MLLLLWRDSAMNHHNALSIETDSVSWTYLIGPTTGAFHERERDPRADVAAVLQVSFLGILAGHRK